MTAGQAIEQADELRPNNQFTDSLKQSWLHQCDARMRTSIVQRSRTADFDAVGADVNWNEGLEYETVRLCAQMDLALGETARAMNELQVYSDYLQEFAVWMRKRYAPAAGAQWRY